MLDLTVKEEARIAQLEATIERGMQTFVEVGLALMEIRDARLYRAEFGTFEEYCQERWGWTRQHTNRMIASAEVTTNLEPLGSILPATERQARPLAPLPPDANTTTPVRPTKPGAVVLSARTGTDGRGGIAPIVAGNVSTANATARHNPR